jgi:DNA-binding response OmpR family regulator
VVASNGEEALYSARKEKPDLVLLDIMMPGMSGYEFLKTYRKERETPVILLTAKMEETDKVLGLELGADDYITKPFGMKELVARINAVLRRSEGKVLAPNILSDGDIRLDAESRSVTINGRPVNLTPSEFDILRLFMSSPGRVFSRSDILLQTQGSTYEGVERTVDVHIRNLRSKIEKVPSSPEYIETVFGVGYRYREVRGERPR